jgi:hypothetical protein
VAVEQGDADAALAYYRQSQALYEKLGDRRLARELDFPWGTLYGLNGRPAGR